MLNKKKNQPKLEEVEASERELSRKVKKEERKDPTRWIALVFFVIFLMISLIFWNQH
ncbi:MAG TPA: hypothetical protein VLH19_01195 [Patescibacteria group bacterium]|nr:hypothetical protein [Patescibacteria group bacterium]